MRSRVVVCLTAVPSLEKIDVVRLKLVVPVWLIVLLTLCIGPIMSAGLNALLTTVTELLGILASMTGLMMFLLIDLGLLMIVCLLCLRVLCMRL